MIRLSLQFITVLLILVFSSLSIIPVDLINKDPPTDIGKLENIFFTLDDQIYFQTEEYFGIRSEVTGDLIFLYKLSKDQRIIEKGNGFDIILSKGRQLSTFLVLEKVIVRQFTKKSFQKDEFTSFEGYIRYDKGVYILTDKFLRYYKDLKPEDNQNIRQYESINFTKEFDNEEFWNIFLSVNENSEMSLFLTSQFTDDKGKNVCLSTISLDQKKVEKKLCTPIINQTIEDIKRTADLIYVEMQTKVYVFNKTLVLIETLDEKPQQYHQGFAVLGNKHTTFKPQEKKTEQYRIVDDFENNVNMKIVVSGKQMVLKKQDKNIATITKDQKLNPRKIWSKERSDDIQGYQLCIEFENGLISFYIIESQSAKIQYVWSHMLGDDKRIIVEDLKKEDQKQLSPRLKC